jgi:L-arabinose isomerase
MNDINNLEVWFITGTQHLYGPETLKQVAADSTKIASAFDKSEKIPIKVVFKPILTTPDSITEICKEANNSDNCIGLIAWMHTFSPAKMWIRGLSILNKPLLHLHTPMGNY